MSRPVLVLASTVAGAAALNGVLAAVPEVPRWVLIALAGITAVGTAVGGVITQSVTVPWKQVAAKTNPDAPGFIAGPAAVIRTGAPVDVTHSTPGDLTP
jgi:hypothetical protein